MIILTIAMIVLAIICCYMYSKINELSGVVMFILGSITQVEPDDEEEGEADG